MKKPGIDHYNPPAGPAFPQSEPEVGESTQSRIINYRKGHRDVSVPPVLPSAVSVSNLAVPATPGPAVPAPSPAVLAPAPTLPTPIPMYHIPATQPVYVYGIPPYSRRYPHHATGNFSPPHQGYPSHKRKDERSRSPQQESSTIDQWLSAIEQKYAQDGKATILDWVALCNKFDAKSVLGLNVHDLALMPIDKLEKGFELAMGELIIVNAQLCPLASGTAAGEVNKRQRRI
jgi:hypothetical protein